LRAGVPASATTHEAWDGRAGRCGPGRSRPVDGEDVCVVTGHLDPDDPASPVRSQALATGPGTLVILMGHDRLALLMSGLVRHGRPADTPVACVQQGTTAEQRVVVSTVRDLAEDVAAAGLVAPVRHRRGRGRPAARGARLVRPRLRRPMSERVTAPVDVLG
jgi:uroporphyrin-III C-methyltransferase/precorrin-2 dehydrogenase/sirohydrochlorin ferrochelatase